MKVENIKMKKLNIYNIHFFIDFTLGKSTKILRNLYVAIDIITNPSIIFAFKVKEYFNFLPTKKVCLLYTQRINILVQYQI